MHRCGNVKSYRPLELRHIRKSAKSSQHSAWAGNKQYDEATKTTTLWSAPESFGAVSSMSEASKDVFSFGIVMSEMYSLQPPWACDCVSEAFLRDVRDALLKGQRPDLVIDASAPHGFFHLIERCWRQEPCDRPRCDNILRRLEEIASCFRLGTSVKDVHGRRLRAHKALRSQNKGKYLSSPRARDTRSNADALYDLVSFKSIQ